VVEDARNYSEQRTGEAMNKILDTITIKSFLQKFQLPEKLQKFRIFKRIQGIEKKLYQEKTEWMTGNALADNVVVLRVEKKLTEIDRIQEQINSILFRLRKAEDGLEKINMVLPKEED
jgi:hypothetical protein